MLATTTRIFVLISFHIDSEFLGGPEMHEVFSASLYVNPTT